MFQLPVKKLFISSLSARVLLLFALFLLWFSCLIVCSFLVLTFKAANDKTGVLICAEDAKEVSPAFGGSLASPRISK
jgi:hypothetical protein